MKNNPLKYFLFAIPLVLAVVLALQAGGNVKEPAVAGAFYPADPVVLGNMVKGYLARVDSAPVEGKLIALIAPHAGYQYSGQVAAYAYKQLAGRTVDTVYLIGPSHYAQLRGAALIQSGAMRTPLGMIKINASAARALLDENADIRANQQAFEKEHSLEVHLPFLQTILKDFTIVPILIGQPTKASFDSLINHLTIQLQKNPNAIIIASTDLSHYHDDARARKLDNRAIDSVTRMSVEDLEGSLSNGSCEMCGGYPVLVTMAVARQLGATHGVLYRYANSGDVTKDRSNVVGYAAIGLYEGRLSKAEQQELLSLAKRTIVSYIQQGKTPEYSTTNPRLLSNGATFVTINRRGSLRGCIGNLQPVMPLYQSVISNAISASSRDPRFPPMSVSELKDMEVEVTILSPLVPLQDIKNIKIGTHGLFLTKGMSSGVLLPQVAEEYKWDVPTFLEQLSLKSGLPKDAWKDAQLYSFTADIIH